MGEVNIIITTETAEVSYKTLSGLHAVVVKCPVVIEQLQK
mgnify:CR=1 FL=1